MFSHVVQENVKTGLVPYSNSNQIQGGRVIRVVAELLQFIHLPEFRLTFDPPYTLASLFTSTCPQIQLSPWHRSSAPQIWLSPGMGHKSPLGSWVGNVGEVCQD